MKYDITCRVFGMVFTKLLKEYYKENYKDVDINKIAKDIKKEYKAIILRTPGLKKGNYMASNLKGAAWFFALARIMPNMTPELMNKMVDEMMYSKQMVKMKKSTREKGKLFSEAMHKKMGDVSKASLSSNDEMDWRFTYTPGKDEVSYTMTRCGVCKLAQRENMLDYLPCMCHMDFSKYEIQGAKLYRTKTLANGDEVCDFHLVRINYDKEKNENTENK